MNTTDAKIETAKLDSRGFLVIPSHVIRCKHEWDRPYRGHGTRICKKCGSHQDN